MSENYEIKIFYDINNQELKKAWNNIYDEGSTFIQSSYYWLSAWWNVKYKNQDAYIITVVSNNEIIGIAPFFYQSTFLVKGLHSFPIHFGDFISYVTTLKNRKEIISFINNYLQTFKKWSFVKIDNVNEKDSLCKDLINQGINKKYLTTISVLSLVKDFESYLSSLSKNRRYKTKKYLKNIQKNHNFEMKVIKSYDGYIDYFSDMRKVYLDRWGKDLSENIYEYRNLALKEHFLKSEVILFLLLVDEKVIGFHLAFDFKHHLYSWKESFDSKFSKYSPGDILRIYLIPEYLFLNNMKGINYMAGDYEYKRSQVGTSGNFYENYQFIFSKGLLGKFIERYYLEYRDTLKKIKDSLQRLKK